MLKHKRYIHNSSLLLLILAVTFMLVYSPHLNYRFPLHVDEWQHIAKGVQIIDEEELLEVNPYFNIPHADTEPGFHVLLVEILLLTGLDPVLHFKFLPGIFAGVSSFALFSLVYRKTRNFLIGFLAMMFFATIRSNVNILGLWFFVPISASIPLTYLFFLAFTNGIKENNKKFILTGMILFLALFLIHPITAEFIIFITAIYSLVNWRNVMKNLSAIIYFSIIPLIGLMVFIFRLWKQWGSGVYYIFIDHLIYEHGWGKVEITYSLPEFYGSLALVLAIVGVGVVVKGRQWLFVIWPLITVGIFYSYNILDFTVVAPYQRMLYYSITGLVVVSAIGLHYVIMVLSVFIRRISSKQMYQNLFSSALILLLVSLVFYNSMKDYYEPPAEAKLYHFLSDNDYNAIIWLEKYGTDNLVFASSWVSVAVYPLSKNRVISVIPAQLEGGNKSIVNEFFKGDCDKKVKVVNEIFPDFVIAREKIDCDFLKEIYAEGDYIYIINDEH